MRRILLGRTRSHHNALRKRGTFAVELMEPRVLMAAFTVVNTSDDPSQGSLRWAILQVNADSSPGSIQFNIPGSGIQTIAIKSALPTITNSVVIDGTTQPGFSGPLLIQLDGSQGGGNTSGLVFAAGGNVVRGLVISEFSAAGIVLEGGFGSVVQQNEVGTDPAGTTPAPNGAGLLILGSAANTIGGTGAGSGNLISANTGYGIGVVSGSQPATANLIVGNLIGTTADGAHALGNQTDGIQLGGPGNTLAGNLISANVGNGIVFSTGAAGNAAVGNMIGTTADGVHAMGNHQDGILLNGAPSNTIGGTTADQGNVISGNLGNGIETQGATSGTLVQGNFIGTDPKGILGLGNQGNGISLGSSQNTIGGPSGDQANIIAYNGSGFTGAGVQLVGIVNDDEILSNSIHDNAGLGINLGNGPTPNHPPGSLPGPNNYQNYPVWSNAKTDGTTTTVTGSLTTQGQANYTVQVFSNSHPDPSGYGQGQTLLGTYQEATDSNGKSSFSLSIPSKVLGGSYISATATDSEGNTSEFSPVIPAQGVTDLAVAIDATPDPVATGGDITYTVKVTNKGQLDAHDVILSDVLPAQASLISITPSQGAVISVRGFNITANLGTIAAGGTATLTIVAQVAQNTGKTITDSASVVLDELDPTPADDSASVTTPVAPVADLALSMSASPAQLDVGGSLTFTMVASNQGPSPATNVIVALPLGPGAAFTSAQSSSGTASFTAGQVTALLGTLAPNQQATVTVVLQAVTPGTFSATAAVSSDDADPTPADNTATASAVLLPVADVSVAIAANPSPVADGQNLLYTITATNQGPDPASGVTLTDVLPTGAAFVSTSSSNSVTPSLASGVVSLAVGDLASGATATLFVTVSPTAPPGTILANSATVAAMEDDPTLADNSATIFTPIRAVSNLRLTMTPGAMSVPIGQALQYSLVVTNLGPADEPDAVVAVPIPSVVEMLSATASQGSGASVQGGVLYAGLGPIPVGGTATVYLNVSPQSSALGLLTMTAAALGYDAQLDSSQAQASATVTVTASSGLSVAIKPQATTAHEGQDLTYQLVVTNAGPSADSNVIATSFLPLNTVFVSATSSAPGQTPVLQSGQITAFLGTIAAGATSTVTVVIRPTLPVPSGLGLGGSVSGNAFDPNLADNTATAQIVVQPSVGLGISLTASPQACEVGKTVTLTALVQNRGPSAATGVVIQIPIPSGVQFVSADSTQGQTITQGGVLLAQLGSLPVGAAAMVTITLAPTVAGSATCTATATADQFNLTPAGSQATATVSVAESPGVIQFGNPVVVVNETAGYALIPVVRSLGAAGTVTVHYQTFGGNATPGIDYQPVAGVLTFQNGQTTQMIAVPVLANPHDNHDEIVGLGIDSPTQGAVLGSTINAVLVIHDTDPDVTPPVVSSLYGNGSAAAITSFVMNFSEPINFSPAVSASDFQIFDLGANGTPGAPGGAVGLAALPTYNPATFSVTLVPVHPLTAGHWYRVQASGTGVAPIQDQAGNPLAGAAPGMAGTNYVGLFGRGTTLVYDDQNSDLVTLKVTGGGYLDEVRDASGEGQVLRVQGGVYHKTTLSGSVARSTRSGNGRTSLGTIEGLGQFGDIRVKLTSPPFTVRQYPFFLGRGVGSLGSKNFVATPTKRRVGLHRH